MAMDTGEAMAAIISLDENRLKIILRRNEFRNIDIANHNSPYQIVIIGRRRDIYKAIKYFQSWMR